MSQDEIIDIIDENDNVLFYTSRKDAGLRHLRHRVVHVVVIDKSTKKIGTIVRSANVGFCPLHHGFAGGVVQSGEDWSSAAKRELKEELGLEVPVIELEKESIESDGNSQNLIDGVFVALIENKNQIIIDPNEIDHVEFFFRENLKELVNKNENLHPLLSREFAILDRHYDTLVSF